MACTPLTHVRIKCPAEVFFPWSVPDPVGGLLISSCKQWHARNLSAAIKRVNSVCDNNFTFYFVVLPFLGGVLG